MAPMNTLLAALVRERSWSFGRFLREYQRTASSLGLTSETIGRKQYDRWMKGDLRSTPRPSACDVLSAIFPGFSIDELLNSSTCQSSDGGATGKDQEQTELPSDNLADYAFEITKHAALCDTSVSPTALERMSDLAVGISQRYPAIGPEASFNEARRVMKVVVSLLESAKRPSELRELFVTAGRLSVLMGASAFDLGQLQPSATLLHAAHSYSSLAGDATLENWTLGSMAILSNWQGEPARGLELAKRALKASQLHSNTFRIRYIEARSHALLGDHKGTHRAIQQGEEALGRSDSEQNALRDIGGKFAYGLDRARASASTAWLDLGDGETAEEYAQCSVGAFKDLPEKTRTSAALSSAQIDLATSYLLRGDLALAQEILEPIFQIRSRRRIIVWTERLTRVRTLLSREPWAGRPSAMDLAQEIDHWIETSPVRLISTSSMRRQVN